MTVRTSKSRRRAMMRGEFDAALRDMRRDRPEPTTETREEWKRRQVQEALANPNRTRRF
jgi:hypothetical protein